MKFLKKIDEGPEKNDTRSKWLIDKFGIKNTIWELIMAIPTWHSIAFVPLMVVWPDLYANYYLSSWVVEIFWTIDFFANFIKAIPEQKSVIEACFTYVTGTALTDLLAFAIPLCTGQSYYVNWVKLFRIANFRYFTGPVDILLKLVV